MQEERTQGERVQDEPIQEERTVLLLGGTGRTGGRVLAQLLARGVRVRAVVRSAERLPAGVRDDDKLTVVEADLLSLSDAEFAGLVDGCDAAVSCLGHNLSAQGMFGQPRDLVTQAVRRVCRAAADVEPARPLRVVVMSSVSVLRPGRRDGHRGPLSRASLGVLRGLLPPARDNQRAADFLLEAIGADGRFVEWAAVRPDTLREGDVSAYDVHAGLVTSLFRPRETRMANVAHFMCELVTDEPTWDRWRGKLPVVVDANGAQ
jgi:NAD(P)-dependent dehydrogenase (short-subunit alcohol dehydrogenase family)